MDSGFLFFCFVLFFDWLILGLNAFLFSFSLINFVLLKLYLFALIGEVGRGGGSLSVLIFISAVCCWF